MRQKRSLKGSWGGGEERRRRRRRRRRRKATDAPS
jgi:hypothetical protein